IFGDKAGWIHMISADDGKLISELRIGENINSTPAILDGQIYVGAFMGKLFRLDLKPKPAEPEKAESKAPAPAPRKRRPIKRKKPLVTPSPTAKPQTSPSA